MSKNLCTHTRLREYKPKRRVKLYPLRKGKAMRKVKLYPLRSGKNMNPLLIRSDGIPIPKRPPLIRRNAIRLSICPPGSCNGLCKTEADNVILSVFGLPIKEENEAMWLLYESYVRANEGKILGCKDCSNLMEEAQKARDEI